MANQKLDGGLSKLHAFVFYVVLMNDPGRAYKEVYDVPGETPYWKLQQLAWDKLDNCKSVPDLLKEVRNKFKKTTSVERDDILLEMWNIYRRAFASKQFSVALNTMTTIAKISGVMDYENHVENTVDRSINVQIIAGDGKVLKDWKPPTHETIEAHSTDSPKQITASNDIDPDPYILGNIDN